MILFYMEKPQYCQLFILSVGEITFGWAGPATGNVEEGNVGHFLAGLLQGDFAVFCLAHVQPECPQQETPQAILGLFLCLRPRF